MHGTAAFAIILYTCANEHKCTDQQYDKDDGTDIPDCYDYQTMLIICAPALWISRNQKQIFLVFMIYVFSAERFCRKYAGVFLIIHMIYGMIESLRIIYAQEFSLHAFPE